MTRSAKAAEHLSLLTDAVRAFADASTEPALLLDTIAKRVSESVSDACVVLVRSDDGLLMNPASAHAVTPELEASIAKRLSQNALVLDEHKLAREVLRTGVPLFAPKTSAEAMKNDMDRSTFEHLERIGVHSVILVPLRARGEAVGLIALYRCLPTSPSFDEDDRFFATSLADHAGLAYANSRLYDAERKARAAAEQSLAAQRTLESRFARLSDSGIVGIIHANMQGHVIDINDALLQMIGHSREDILSGAVPWQSLTPPEWRHVDQRVLEQIAQGSALTEPREKELLRKDGTRVPVLIGTALDKGRREGTSFVIDLTERKKAEERIAKLEADRTADAKFRAVLEAAPDAMVIMDEARHIVLVNAQAETIFGWTRDEMMGKPIEMLIAPSHRSVRSYGVKKSFTMKAIRKDGTEFPVDVRRRPIATEEGTLIASSIRDVSQRMKEEEQLVRSKEAAESANRELESFSYSVAHDLRSPLRGINGFAQVLIETNGERLDEDGRRALTRITNASKRMANLIDALLSLARFSRAELRRISLDMTELARAAVARVGSRVGTEFVIQPDMRVDGDPMLVAAVLDNLVGNAFKFTEKSENVRIEVGVVAGTDVPTFFVKDNGVGFDMTYAHKLFSPFQRLHGMEEFAGTGIGLATVQRIVQRHGGRAWAEGAVNEGATFFFTLSGAKLEKE